MLSDAARNGADQRAFATCVRCQPSYSFAAARTSRAVHLVFGKSGKLSVAFDDGFALGVAQNVLDVARSHRARGAPPRRSRLRPAPAIVAHDFGRRRQPLRLVGSQRRPAVLARNQPDPPSSGHRRSPGSRRWIRPGTSDGPRRPATSPRPCVQRGSGSRVGHWVLVECRRARFTSLTRSTCGVRKRATCGITSSSAPCRFQSSRRGGGFEPSPMR